MPKSGGTGSSGGSGPGTGRGRGFGQGGMKSGRGTGPQSQGYCVCPKCGTKVPHQAGVPCYNLSCPSCKTKMIRK
jgi:hypothetical protein